MNIAFESSLASLPSERVATPQDSAGPGAATPILDVRIDAAQHLAARIDDALDTIALLLGATLPRITASQNLHGVPRSAFDALPGDANTSDASECWWKQLGPVYVFTNEPPVEEASC